jgi:hypothetical protein
MDLLATLVARAGVFTGEGVNHEGEDFAGRLEVIAVMGGRAVTMHYTAVGLDGQHLHEEFTLLAPGDDGRLCLWPVMEELPVVMVHRAVCALGNPSDDDSGVREVFATVARDAVDAFREEISIECMSDGIIVYAHAWGMPGGEFGPRSRCELRPAALSEASR